MENRELLIEAKNTNGTVIFERDDSESYPGEELRVNGVFIVTVKTNWGFDNCIAKFRCYDAALRFFRDAIKRIYAQELTVPVSQFLWMTASVEEEME